eukprot:10136357-Lingulodinium_polyedra.AAC.1
MAPPCLALAFLANRPRTFNTAKGCGPMPPSPTAWATLPLAMMEMARRRFLPLGIWGGGGLQR